MSKTHGKTGGDSGKIRRGGEPKSSLPARFDADGNRVSRERGKWRPGHEGSVPPEEDS